MDRIMKTRFSPSLRILSLTLALSMIWLDVAWALDPREKLAQDKLAIQSLTDGQKFGGGSESYAEFNQSQVDQMNLVQSMSESSANQSAASSEGTASDPVKFTLKTPNQDLIEYVGSTISKITRADGTIFNGINLSAGLIQDATILLTDGSTHKIEGNKVTLTRPDGSKEIYVAGKLNTIIPKTGEAITVTHDTTNQQVTFDNTASRLITDDKGKPIHLWDKAKDSKFFFTDGLLNYAEDAAGNKITYQKTVQNGQTTLEIGSSHSGPFNLTDSSGNTFFYDAGGNVTKIVLATGETLEGLTFSPTGILTGFGTRKIGGDVYRYDASGLLTEKTSGATRTVYSDHTPQGIPQKAEVFQGTVLMETQTLYPSGRIQMIRKANSANIETFYDEDFVGGQGRPKSVTYNGVQELKYLEYYPGSAQASVTAIYLNGQFFAGIRYTSTGVGQTLLFGYGDWREFYPNGSTKFFFQKSTGYKHEYYENGKLKILTKPNGDFEYYNENGTLYFDYRASDYRVRAYTNLGQIFITVYQWIPSNIFPFPAQSSLGPAAFDISRFTPPPAMAAAAGHPLGRRLDYHLSDPDSSELAERLGLPKKLVYENGKIKQLELLNGATASYVDGNLSSVTSPDDKSAEFHLTESPFFNLLNVGVTQNGVESVYDAQGRLSVIKLPSEGLTIHYQPNSDEIDYIDKEPDGVRIYVLEPVVNGVILGAKVIEADGGVKTYSNGKLVSYVAPDAVSYTFDNGRLTQFLTAQKISYRLDYTVPTAPKAVMISEPTSDPLLAVQMEFDASLKLLSFTKQNGEVTQLLDNKIHEIRPASGEKAVYEYLTDAEGRPITRVTQGRTVTTYDENESPLESVISPSAADPHTLKTLYEYGKIRKVFKDGVELLQYSYTYDAGKETIHIHDLASKTMKDYQDGSLVTSLEEETKILSTYTYDAGKKVQEVRLSRLGRELTHYVYTYEGETTCVTDVEGVRRIYDAQSRLIAVESNGERREYEYISRADTDVPDTLETFALIQPTAALVGGLAQPGFKWTVTRHDTQGRPVEFRRSDKVRKVVYDTAGRLAQETIWKIQDTSSTALDPAMTLETLMIHAYTASGVLASTRTVDRRGHSPSETPLPTEGTTRSYVVNASGNLTDYSDSLSDPVAQGNTPAVVTHVSSRIVTRERLVSRRLKDGSVAEYTDGRVTTIRTSGGLTISDVELNEDHTFKQGTLRLADGTKLVFSRKEIVEEIFPNGTHAHFEDGLVRSLTDVDGNALSYTYDLNQDGSVAAIWVADADQDPAFPRVKLKYDSSDRLLGLNFTDILTSVEVNAQATHVYEGGENGPLSIDGNFETMQYESRRHYSGGIGAVVSEHRFPVPQTVDSVTFKMYAYGQAGGNYAHDYEAYYHVEVLKDGSWQRVPGSFVGIEKQYTAGSYETPTGTITLNNLNLAGVTAVRATALGFGNSSDNANANGAAGIYEFSWKLAEQSHYAFSPIKNAAGQTTGSAFAGFLGTISFDASGGLVNTPPSLAERVSGLDDRLAKFISSPYPDHSYKSADASKRLTDVRFKTSLATALDAVPSLDTAVEQEFDAEGVLETQSKADGTVTLFNADGKPEVVLNEQGETSILYTYDEDGNIEKVLFKEAREKLPHQIDLAESGIAAQRAESLRLLADQKSLATADIKQSADAARQKAQGYLSDLMSGRDSLAGLSAKGKLAKQSKSRALDQYQEAINQVQFQLNEINRQEAEAYERLDNEVQSVSQDILTNAQSALEQLKSQEVLLQNEILRQEIAPVVFDVYRRILGRDPSADDYQAVIDRLDFETGDIITSSAERQAEIALPAVRFDGNGDYLTVDDTDQYLSFGRGDFEIDLSVNILDRDRNQTILDIGGWYDGIRLIYFGEESRFEWALAGNERQVWNFKADPTRLTRIVLKRTNGILQLTLDGQAAQSYQNTGYVSSRAGVRIGYALANFYYLRGTLASLVMRDSAGKVLEIAPQDGDEFVKDTTGFHQVYFKGDAKLDPAAGWFKRTETVRDVLATAKVGSLLSAELSASAEFRERNEFVSGVKNHVAAAIAVYRNMSQSNRVAFAAALGLAETDLEAISAPDADAILDWIRNGSLHFGQSAFNALDMLLKEKNMSVDRAELAKRAILIDILAGVITPVDEGDLVISMFALKTVAKSFGVTLSAAEIGYEDLKGIYDTERAVVDTISTTSDVPAPSIRFDGNGDYLALSDSADWDFGTGDWTIETWVKFEANQNGTLFCRGTNDFGVSFYNNALYISHPSVDTTIRSFVPVVGTWYHLAFERVSGKERIYVNGVKQGADVSNAHDIVFSTPPTIGAYSNGNSDFFKGWMQGFRVSKGIARYGSNFSPSQSVFVPDSYTVLLLTGEESGGSKLFADSASNTKRVLARGDVKTDAAIFTQTKKVTTTQKVIARYPTSIANPSALTEAQKQDIIDNPMNYNPRVIAHTLGDHFVVVNDVTDDQVVYTDTSIGRDGENEVVTVSKDEFLKLWQGYVLANERHYTGLSDLARARLTYSNLLDIYDRERPEFQTAVVPAQVPGSSIQFAGEDDYLSFAASDDWKIGQGDFTIETWIRLDEINKDHTILNHGTYGTSYSWILSVNYLNRLQLATGPGTWESGPSFTATSFTFDADKWHHIAVQRRGNTFSMWIDGVLATGYSTSISNFSVVSNPLLVGKMMYSGPYDLKGSLDGLRISKGLARYSGNFMPPQERFIADSSTKLLLYADPVLGIKDRSPPAHSFVLNGQVEVSNLTSAQTVPGWKTAKLITRYPASVQNPSQLTPQQIQNILDHPEAYNPHFTVNTRSFGAVTLLDVTVYEVMMLQANGQVRTVSKNAFVSDWDGRAQTDATSAHHAAALQIANQANPTPGFRALTDLEARAVRGAGLIGSILGIIAPFMNIIIPGSGFFFTFLSAAVNAIEGDFLSAIASIVTLGFGGFGDVFKGVFKGITQSLGAVGQIIGNAVGFLSNIFSPVIGFVKGAFDSFSALIGSIPGIAGEAISGIVNTAVSVGVNFGVSKGLEMLGVSPEISGLLGKFASGALLGAIETPKAGATQMDMVRSNVLTVNALQNGMMLGAQLGLSPELTQILSLSIGAITGDLSIAGNGTGSIALAFRKVLPNIGSSLALYGVGQLGENLGISTTLTGLIAAPLGGLIGGIVGGGQNTQAAILKSINDALLKGGASLLLDYVREKSDWDPLLTGILANAATGGLLGVMNGRGVLGGIGDSFVRTLNDMLGFDYDNLDPNSPAYSYEKSRYLLRTQNFVDSIDAIGFEATLEAHATQIFQREAIENLFRDGGVRDFLTKRARLTQLDGANVIQIKATDQESLFLNLTSLDMIGREYVDSKTGLFVREQGSYGFSPEGILKVKNGSQEFMKNGQTIRIEFVGYEVQSAILYQGAQILQEASASYGQPLTLRIQADGSLEVKNGTLYDYVTLQRETYFSGELIAKSSSDTVTFQSLSGQEVAGINTVSHEYREGSEVAIHIGVDSYMSSQVQSGNVKAASTIWNTVLPYLNNAQQGAGNLLNTLNIKRLDFANGVDYVIDKMFNKLKDQPTGNLLLDLPIYYGNAGVELTKIVLKGFVDVIRIGDNLDELWNESTQAWKALNEGNYSDAAKHGLGFGMNALIEGTRLLSLLPVVGGSIKLIKSGTTQLVEGVLEHGDDAAKLVQGLLKKGDEAALGTLSAVMKNPQTKKLVLQHLNDLDDVDILFKRELIGVDDLKYAKIRRSSEFLRQKQIVEGDVPSWQPQTWVDEYIYDGSEELVRVFRPTYDDLGNLVNRSGEWVVRKNLIIGKSAQEIDDLLALPAIYDSEGVRIFRTHFIDYKPSPGAARLRRGIAGKVEITRPNGTKELWGNGGMEQIEIVSGRSADDFKDIYAIVEAP